MVEQGLRQIYQNVVNIDSAMTELKRLQTKPIIHTMRFWMMPVREQRTWALLSAIL